MKKIVLLIIGFFMMMASMYLDFVFVSTPKGEGVEQRILYMMVPSGWLALLSFGVIFICSILYLTKRQERWDVIARSAAEIGIVTTSMTLLVGTIWGGARWGDIWATWRSGEPRLMTTLVLWFIYVAYFLVRSFANEESRGARFAAVVGIVGFVDVPIVALATTLWPRGMHPPLMVFQGTLPPDILLTLMFSISTFTVLFFVLLVLRITMANNEIELRQLREKVV